MRKTGLTLAAALLCATSLTGQGQPRRDQADAPVTILKPARVFDGDTMHEGWVVRVKGERIDYAGPEPGGGAANARVVNLPGTTLTPGLVEAHSHILLHAYSEASWESQVSKEGLALRVARATNHLRSTLMAGFTTVRDLGTEGAGYADVELRDAVRQGIIPGPRVLAATRAIVATGSYQPRFVPEWSVPQGAEEADGIDSLTRVVRDQIGRGADWIKLYGDYRWGPLPGSHPTFTLDEMKRAVEDGGERGSAGRGPHQHARRNAARRARQRRDDRTRQRRDAGDLQADGRASRRVVPDAHRGRRTVAAGRSRLGGESAAQVGVQGRP